MRRAVALRGVSKSYREGEIEHSVLENVEITVGAGEFIALLGPSGSGKSTLLNLIGGIDLPDAGEVEVAGAVINHLSERQRTLHRRQHIGLVFQFFNLISTLTVEENLLLPLELQGSLDQHTKAAALDLLARVGLKERRHSFPDRLSGGEQQRVAIARALVHSPQVILADEPTGNLDHETGLQVMELLESIRSERGATLIMATHSRQLAARADALWSIRDARLERVAVDVTPGARRG